MDKKNYCSSVATLFICFVIWGGQIFGLCDLPEGMIYDFLVGITPIQEQATQDILILETDYSFYSEGDVVWLNLLNTLKKMQPQAIIYSFLPPYASEKFYQTAEQSNNVFFARQFTREKQRTILEALPSQAADRKLKTGLLAVPPTSYGVHRRYENGYVTPEGYMPSLAATVAARILNKTPGQQDTGSFFINFFACSPSLPTLSYERLVFEEIPPALFHDKTILITFAAPLYSHGFETPINLGKESMSLVEYTGYALETLLEDKKPTPASLWLSLALIFLIGLCSLLAFRSLPPIFHLFYTFFTLLLILIFSWISARIFLVWLPAAELLFLQAALFIVIPLVRLREREISLRNILLDHSTSLRKRFFPERLAETDEYWSHIINMVNQTLHLNRSIFLEAVEGDHRVREVISLNCSIDDIVERRRDYQRTPYLTALAEGGPISVSQYLTAGPQGEEQFLVPLKTSVEILGFWAFGLPTLQRDERKTLLETVRFFAGKISLALQEHKDFQRLERLQKKRITRFFGTQAVDTMSSQLDQMILLTKRKMQALESLINTLSTATVLYDPFGRLIQINSRMSEILRNLEGISGKNYSSLDLGVRLTGKKPEKIRKLLSQVITEKKSLHLPVIQTETDSSAFELIIHPVMLENESQGKTSEPSFNILGILFELLDISDVQETWQLQEELFEQTNFHLHRDLEQMRAAEELLLQENPDTFHKNKALSLLHQSREEIQHFVEDLDGFISKKPLTEAPDLFPVNPAILTRETVHLLRQEAKRNRLTWSIHAPEHIELVYAGPAVLKQLLADMLKVLIHDAMSETTISIDFLMRQDGVLCTLSNTGYGVPDATFQQYLFDDHASRSDNFTGIHQALPDLEQWGGCLCGKSEVGQGIRFELLLQRFH